jgi:hypothetical protein
MRTHALAAAPSLALHAVAREPESPWEARGFEDLVPPATLPEARAWRDELAGLLARERAAAADFLLALADFDRRRGWERLGHASLFAFLTRELGLSAGAAQLRLSAARLLPRHAPVEAALRSGRLCISAVGQLSRVLTPANEAEVLPRFLGLSAREAQEVAAALIPSPCPPRREVVTLVTAAPVSRAPAAAPSTAAALEAPPLLALPAASSPPAAQLHTCEVPAPARVTPRTPAVEPVSADLRRLHLTVSKGVPRKGRRGADRSLPRAPRGHHGTGARGSPRSAPRAAGSPEGPGAPAASTLDGRPQGRSLHDPFSAHPEPFDSAQDKLRASGAESRGPDPDPDRPAP